MDSTIPRSREYVDRYGEDSAEADYLVPYHSWKNQAKNNAQDAKSQAKNNAQDAKRQAAQPFGSPSAPKLVAE